jgi:hypothetical protein
MLGGRARIAPGRRGVKKSIYCGVMELQEVFLKEINQEKDRFGTHRGRRAPHLAPRAVNGRITTETQRSQRNSFFSVISVSLW